MDSTDIIVFSVICWCESLTALVAYIIHVYLFGSSTFKGFKAATGFKGDEGVQGRGGPPGFDVRAFT